MFWRKNNPSIPPVESPAPNASRPSSYSSVNNAPTSVNARENYNRSRGVGGVYSCGGADVEQDRSELFAGYNAEKDPAPGEENEDDRSQQTRFIKQESVNSSRNALRLAREAEETARNTLTRLGDKSERLENTERHLDISKGHSIRADDKTNEPKQLNRSIFRPVIVFNKDAKRVAQEAKVQARYEEEREERERTFANASDDELEDKLDDNLDEISDMTKRLKALGTAMNAEHDQNKINNIEQKAVGLDVRLFRYTERLKQIK
ncbi:hypothetical protein BT96DRAFT_956563 [Gymnopus androsaceus JB14]|uniref:t-SNARE coiled-coil homology domain-containing protein n=1 Tax=Gymnopus androsaceus JB14 TaxID=1447944 RepID=A0A6A4HUI0_9AGAR|nr:hypothetical protein BT96DRAFT_956563 [Gymnopus androsaceus JB14]